MAPDPDPPDPVALRWTRPAPSAGVEPPVASVPPGTVVYAIGDVHGCSDLLAALQRGIELDAGMRPARRRVVVYLGDYISRGTDTRGVLDRVIGWRPRGFEIVTLMGNHEQMLIGFLEGNLFAGRRWFTHGGREVAAQYLAPDLLPQANRRAPIEDLARLREHLYAALPSAHRQLLQALALKHHEGGYLFVHAGIRPGLALEAQTSLDLLWIRGRFLDSTAHHGPIVVHGHCVSATPEIRPNRIGIDTGAWRTGVLTCLVLEGGVREFLQTTAGAPIPALHAGSDQGTKARARPEAYAQPAATQAPERKATRNTIEEEP